MELVIGNDWRDFFDVIIVGARKPKFFTDENRPIRLFDTASDTQLWDRVTNLEKGKIYFEVGKLININQVIFSNQFHPTPDFFLLCLLNAFPPSLILLFFFFFFFLLI